MSGDGPARRRRSRPGPEGSSAQPSTPRWWPSPRAGRARGAGLRRGVRADRRRPRHLADAPRHPGRPGAARPRPAPGSRCVSGRSLTGRAGLVAVADAEPGWLLVGGHGAEVAGEPAAPDGPTGRTDDLPAEADPRPGGRRPARRGPGRPAGGDHRRGRGRRGRAPRAPRSSTSRPRWCCTPAWPRRRRRCTPREAVLEGPGTRPGVHVKPGKDVVELAVLRADKGSAVRGAARADAARPPCCTRATTSPTRTPSRCSTPRRATSGSRWVPGPPSRAPRRLPPRTSRRLLDRLADLLAAPPLRAAGRAVAGPPRRTSRA